MADRRGVAAAVARRRGGGVGRVRDRRAAGQTRRRYVAAGPIAGPAAGAGREAAFAGRGRRAVGVVGRWAGGSVLGVERRRRGRRAGDREIAEVRSRSVGHRGRVPDADRPDELRTGSRTVDPTGGTGLRVATGVGPDAGEHGASDQGRVEGHRASPPGTEAGRNAGEGFRQPDRTGSRPAEPADRPAGVDHAAERQGGVAVPPGGIGGGSETGRRATEERQGEPGPHRGHRADRRRDRHRERGR